MPVTEIRRIKRHRLHTIDERLAELRRHGVLVRPGAPGQKVKPATRRPGALARYLAERGNRALPTSISRCWALWLPRLALALQSY